MFSQERPLNLVQKHYVTLAAVLVRERVFEMYRAGKTTEEIGKFFGCEHPSPLFSFIRRLVDTCVARGEIDA